MASSDGWEKDPELIKKAWQLLKENHSAPGVIPFAMQGLARTPEEWEFWERMKALVSSETDSETSSGK